MSGHVAVPGAGRRVTSLRPSTMLLGAMIAALLVVLSCTPPPPPDPGVSTIPEQIQAMLRARAGALARGDVEGYLRPVADKALDVERRIGRGAVRAPIVRFDMLLENPEGLPPAARAREVRVDLIYWYRGLPTDNRFRIQLLYDLRKRGTRWIVTRSIPLDPLPMWATGPVALRQSPHFLAITRPTTVDRVEALLPRAERALRSVAAQLSFRQDSRYLIVVPGSEAEYNQIPGFAGSLAAVPRRDVEHGRTLVVPEDRHMIVNLEGLDASIAQGKIDPDLGLSPREVLQHEMGHLALARVSDDLIPGWVREGAAILLSGEDRTGEWRDGLEAGVFDRMSFVAMSRRPRLASSYEYAYAKAAVDHLVREFGKNTFFDFYRSYQRFGLVGQPEVDMREATSRLLRIFYRLDERELDRRARRWIREAVKE